jgi:chemotaxis family two-component system response regulator Rcp1
VEDNQADVFLMREALRAARLPADLEVVNDGEKAVQFFEAADRDPNARCPAFIILDLNIPRIHGTEVLSRLRQSRTCSGAIVLIVTSSDSNKDREEAARLGANGYFRKPSRYQAYLELGNIVRTMLGIPVDKKGTP